ncbi:MAG: hypothetical protein A3K06_01565 [Candidatus Doudnabacteria bacterium RIFCSPHIGHO2_01_52_17]|uniref:Glycoside hydrolase family 42 N-terminal domain-containing protein n=1 Tax=Candidatus Doudnabacteria bacterium RIFCSPHIGHO2_01_52_17 TaxID=1817820 RepID=A0A1F5NAC3_9BACT|nr:MAG: hypothetical protein A3K06_01565 [Candidatus Doudnabacteria bacterium RIFCSPHIGHO2_01_52_17]
MPILNKNLRRLLLVAGGFPLATLVFVGAAPFFASGQSEPSLRTLWEIQAVDTVKYSRDEARLHPRDPNFDAVIDQQMRAIASLGATHVALGTPYDEEFLPFLERWVSAARKHRLNVWYRGNWSGWEGWYDYPPMSRGQHLVKTENFILDHPFLFEDGDIFTACPECENGGPGDPRRNSDVRGHRQFLIDEFWITSNAFAKIKRDVRSNLASMNGDVARLVMDRATTKALGGIVTVDHYVGTPAKLARDLSDLVEQSGGLIVLGETGVPIPDIHGRMNEREQALWIDQALAEVARLDAVIGVNYWVNVGGSTELWSSSGVPREGVAILKKYFSPQFVTGFVTDAQSQPVRAARVDSGYRDTMTTESGFFEIALPSDDELSLKIAAPGFAEQKLVVRNPDEPLNIALQQRQLNWWQRLWARLGDFFRNLTGTD